jgi:hypothetical protein
VCEFDFLPPLLLLPNQPFLAFISVLLLFLPPPQSFRSRGLERPFSRDLFNLQ